MSKVSTRCIIVADGTKLVTVQAYLDVTMADQVEILAEPVANIFLVHVNGRPVFRISQPGEQFDLIDVSSLSECKSTERRRTLK